METDVTDKPIFPKKAAEPSGEVASEASAAASLPDTEPAPDMLALLTNPAAQGMTAEQIAAAYTGPELSFSNPTPRRVLQPVGAVTPEIEQMLQKRAELEKAMAALDEQIVQEEVAHGTHVFHFVATKVQLRTWVTVAGREVPIQFERGLYKTVEQGIAAAIRMSPSFARGDIREQKSAAHAALRAKLAAEREHLRRGTMTGVTGSTAGADAAFTQRDQQLAQVESRLL